MSVKIITNDNYVFNVPTNIAKMSSTISNMLNDVFDTINDAEINLPSIDKKTYELVLEYCSKFVSDSRKPLDTKKPIMLNWEKEYCSAMKLEELYQVILAANYLEIPSLLDAGCCHIAYMIKGKTPDEIRETFNIDDDLTELEKEQLKVENKWEEEN
jgi:S-phase kinase-associated protein 1